MQTGFGAATYSFEIKATNSNTVPVSVTTLTFYLEVMPVPVACLTTTLILASPFSDTTYYLRDP